MLSYLSLSFLFFFISRIECFRSNQLYNKNAVLLSDVQVLTLYQNRITTGRRGAPVSQLVCTGGNAQWEAEKEIDIVQCYNQGSDGREIQWKCETQFKSSGLRFGKIQVGCEGYESSDDEYILVGSCGLEYELIRTYPAKQQTQQQTNGKKKTTTTTTTTSTPIKNEPKMSHTVSNHDDGTAVVGMFMALLIFAAVVILILFMTKPERERTIHKSQNLTKNYNQSPPINRDDKNNETVDDTVTRRKKIRKCEPVSVVDNRPIIVNSPPIYSSYHHQPPPIQNYNVINTWPNIPSETITTTTTTVTEIDNNDSAFSSNFFSFGSESVRNESTDNGNKGVGYGGTKNR